MRLPCVIAWCICLTVYLTVAEVHNRDLTDKDGEAQAIVSRERRSGHGLVALAAVAPLATLLFTTAHFIYGVHTGELLKEKIRDIDIKIIQLDRTLEILMDEVKSLQVGQEWVTAAAKFGDDTQRLKYFFHYLQANLWIDRESFLVPRQRAARWADSVLSLRDDGAYQVLLNIHDMVMGESPVFSGRSLLEIYSARLDGKDENYWEMVDEFKNFLLAIQVAGYCAWATAKNVRGLQDEVYDTVQGVGRERLLEQIELMNHLTRDDSRSWPAGSYGLVQTKRGCPTGSWEKGYRYFDTNDLGIFSSGKGNRWSIPLNMAGTYEINNMEWHFCMKQNSGGEHKWPSGKYCLFKKGACPGGAFSSGWLFWDDQDKSNSNEVVGSHPDGVFNHNTRIDFCCRTDGDLNDPITLPTQTPFYLFPVHSSGCQRVADMKVTEEWFWWDEENIANIGDEKWPYPKDTDTTGKNHKISMCYYTRV